MPWLEVVRTYWMAIHAELYDTARIRAMRFWLAELIAENQHRLTPSRGRLETMPTPRRIESSVPAPALV
jgi:hypothetical protein